jgi:hypothetical protein
MFVYMYRLILCVSVMQFITNIFKMNTVVSKVGGTVVLLANGRTLIYRLWHGSGD